MKFEIDKYDETYAMHCESREENEAFSAYLDSIGKRWRSGRRYTQLSYYDTDGDDMCFYFHSGTCGRVSLADDETKLLRFSDFELDDFLPAKKAEDYDVSLSFDSLFS